MIHSVCKPVALGGIKEACSLRVKGERYDRFANITLRAELTADDLRQQGSAMSPGDLVLARARMAHESGFDGVVASGQEAQRIREAVGPGFLVVTPGIRLPGSTTDDQERITTPESAIKGGADHIVVGRPITQADDPKAAAETFVHHIREALAALHRGAGNA